MHPVWPLGELRLDRPADKRPSTLPLRAYLIIATDRPTTHAAPFCEEISGCGNIGGLGDAASRTFEEYGTARSTALNSLFAVCSLQFAANTRTRRRRPSLRRAISFDRGSVSPLHSPPVLIITSHRIDYRCRHLEGALRSVTISG